jgi:hypothetical protein
MTKRSGNTAPKRWLMAAAFVVVGGAAACSDATGARAGGNQLAFSVARSQTPATPATAPSLALVPVTKNGHTLDLTQVAVTVQRAELKRAHEDACKDDDENENETAANHNDGGNSGPGSDGAHGEDENDDECPRVKLGPTTVDLPLSGDVVTVPADAFPAGTFREIEVRISQIHLVGTFDGTAFDVTLPINIKTEIEFETPLVVTAGTPTSITVTIPVSDWLVGADGSLVDPSKISASPTLLAQLRSRIAASLHAFEDRDHDGHDDHHGHGDN